MAAYARVSTDKDDQQNSLDSQKNFFAKYIKDNSEWELVEVYYDEGFSGTTTQKRKGFNRMIANARANRIDLILSKEVSRFARNTVDTLTYARELRTKGVGIVFILDNLDTRKHEDDFRLGIMAGVAQEESRKTSERVKWGQRRCMERGVVFGRDLLGYTVKDGKMSINQEEAEVVKLIYHKYLHEEKGTHVIARELWEAGISPMRVKKWSNIVILRVLRNEKYVGDLFQQKTFTPDYIEHKKKYNNGQLEMVRLYDHHDAIIDRDTWDRVQAELARRSPNDEAKSRHSYRYWCSGKLTCGECGSSFVRRTKHIASGDYVSWRCYQSAKFGVPKKNDYGDVKGCIGESINDITLMYCAKYAIRHVQINHERITKELMRDIRNIFDTSSSINTKKIEKEIERLRAEKVTIVRQAAKGIISDEDIQSAIKACDEEIETCNKRIKAASTQNIIREEQAAKLNSYVDEIKEILTLDSDNEAVCRELTERIVAFDGGVVVFYLKCVPYGIKLQYIIEGRGKNYSTKVVDFTIVA